MAATREAIASCSFCLKPNDEVGTLVAGPGVYICDGCVALCREIIAAHAADSAHAERLPPWELETDLERVLAGLPAIAEAAGEVERHLAEWVRRARRLGATWARIGAALGVTRQSAWERFSGGQ